MSDDPRPCEHFNFACHVKVGRLTEVDDGPVKMFHAYVTVKCADCQTDFSFPGFATGSHPSRPMVNVGATELEVRIVPGLQPLPEKLSYTLGFGEPEGVNKQ